MIVVADASPIHYLVLIEAVDVLQPLYTHVVVPESVAQELKQTAAPEGVQRWIARPPDWCEVRPDPPSDPALEKFLDRGERAAISLAALLPADRVLIDEWEGRNDELRAESSASPALWAFWLKRISITCWILTERLRGSSIPTSTCPSNS